MKFQPNQSGRLLLIDGLRGVAAVLVLLFHISTMDFFNRSPGWVMPLNWTAGAFGPMGIVIFFVISGFVIAYSMRNARVTVRYAGNFAIRRSLRLDPPYWAMIAVTFATCFVFTRCFQATTYPIPSTTALAANVFYLQGILREPQLVIVFWTLCYEIQFYLTYLLFQFGAQRIGRSPAGVNRALTAILTLTGFASLCCFIWEPAPAAWCYNWWFLFAFGALVCRQMLVKAKRMIPIAIATFIGAAAYGGYGELWAGALTGFILYLAIQLDRLSTWFSARPLQYLGRISYSLYLTHVPVLMILGRIGVKVPWTNGVHSIPAYLIFIVVSIIGADLFYRLIEKPSHQLAIRFGQRRRVPLGAPKREPAVEQAAVLT